MRLDSRRRELDKRTDFHYVVSCEAAEAIPQGHWSLNEEPFLLVLPVLPILEARLKSYDFNIVELRAGSGTIGAACSCERHSSFHRGRSCSTRWDSRGSSEESGRLVVLIADLFSDCLQEQIPAVEVEVGLLGGGETADVDGPGEIEAHLWQVEGIGNWRNDQVAVILE